MNKQQDRRYNMFGAVLRFCLDNPGALALNPAFKRSVDTLQQYTVAIAGTLKGQAVNTTGLQGEKDGLQNALIDNLGRMCSLLSAYAADKKNVALKERSHLTKSGLRYMQDGTIAEVAKNVLADVRAAAAADGGDYGIGTAEATELEAAVGAFTEHKDVPRNARAKRSSKTLSLADLMKVTSTHLREKMDKMMAFYKDKDPEFHATYFENRKVMDVGVKGKPVK
jgi:hypothetical protein